MYILETITLNKRTKIKTYLKRLETFLSEYAFIIVLWQVVQKLCVEKKWIPPGLSIEFLRQSFYKKDRPYTYNSFCQFTNHIKILFMCFFLYLYLFTYLILYLINFCLIIFVYEQIIQKK